MCQAAKTELQETCCFQMCSICAKGGNLYWDNPVTLNDVTFACGELSWILSGGMIEEGTDKCSDMQNTYFDACCNGPSPDIPQGDKCEICPSGKDWYAQVSRSRPMFPNTLLAKGVGVEKAYVTSHAIQLMIHGLHHVYFYSFWADALNLMPSLCTGHLRRQTNDMFGIRLSLIAEWRFFSVS